LIAGLLAGLMIFELVQVIAARHQLVGVSHRTGRIIAVVLVTAVTLALLGLGTFGLATLVTDRSDNLPALMSKMADIVGSARIYLPPWIQDHVPQNLDELEKTAAVLASQPCGALQVIGERFGGVLLHVLVGMIIGAMVALTDLTPTRELPVLSRSLEQRVSRLGQSFRASSSRRSVFGAEHLADGDLSGRAVADDGDQLPLTKTMILVTFFVGLLPVVGNLISTP